MYNPVPSDFFLVIKALFMLLLNILPNEKKNRNYSKKKKKQKKGIFCQKREKNWSRNNVIHGWCLLVLVWVVCVVDRSRTDTWLPDLLLGSDDMKWCELWAMQHTDVTWSNALVADFRVWFSVLTLFFFGPQSCFTKILNPFLAASLSLTHRKKRRA